MVPILGRASNWAADIGRQIDLRGVPVPTAPSSRVVPGVAGPAPGLHIPNARTPATPGQWGDLLNSAPQRWGPHSRVVPGQPGPARPIIPKPRHQRRVAPPPPSRIRKFAAKHGKLVAAGVVGGGAVFGASRSSGRAVDPAMGTPRGMYLY